VAVGDGTRWIVRDVQAGQTHSERLLPFVTEVLAAAGWSLGDLDGIAFGAGPGSFTGIRIGCGVAQGLALGAGRPVVPVSTLAAIAHAHWCDRGDTRVVACLDARMREVYVAAYDHGAAGWSERHGPAVLLPEEIALDLPGSWVGAGSGFAAYPALAGRLGLVAVDASARPTAQAIGDLALMRLRAGEGVAAGDALPVYVRHRVALTSAERAAGARL